MEAMKTMIHYQDLPMNLWDEATRTTIYVQNRLSDNALGFKTPDNMYTKKKPEVRNFKMFGYPVYLDIPKEKRTKLDPFGKKGIFVGYCEVSKAFRIYISGFHHIEISRDVTFDEEIAPDKSRRCEVHEEDVPPRRTEVEPSPEIVASEDHDMLKPQEPATMDIS